MSLSSENDYKTLPPPQQIINPINQNNNNINALRQTKHKIFNLNRLVYINLLIL